MKAAIQSAQNQILTDARARRVSVSHPHGNANSYHAALALSESGWLERFETGILIDGLPGSLARISSAFLERASNRLFPDIRPENKRSHPTYEMLSRLGGKAKRGGPTSQVSWYDFLFWGHDRQIARSLGAGLDAVYAYEDAARSTFAEAKKLRLKGLYELPLGYYKGVAHEINRGRKDWPVLQASPYSEPEWKQQRKDAELDLADVVVVASKWSEKSLSYSEMHSSKPVVNIPYGTPVDEITPRSTCPSDEFTILFAGQVGLRKGVPHLIQAWEKLGLKDAKLLTAGSMNLPKAYLDAHADSFKYLGALPRAELLELMKQVDLFVFPSLADGFGLVIGEAMACGVPVLTTEHTGGPSLIDDGIQGWCVEAHAVEPLCERIEWAYANRDEVFEMGRLARVKAEQWTWADYRRRLIEELSVYL